MMRSGARSASGGGGDEAPRAPPYCIECRFMLQRAFLFRGNSSDTVRRPSARQKSVAVAPRPPSVAHPSEVRRKPV